MPYEDVVYKRDERYEKVWSKPVTSLRALGCGASRADVVSWLTGRFAREFGLEIRQPALI